MIHAMLSLLLYVPPTTYRPILPAAHVRVQGATSVHVGLSVAVQWYEKSVNVAVHPGDARDEPDFHTTSMIPELEICGGGSCLPENCPISIM